MDYEVPTQNDHLVVMHYRIDARYVNADMLLQLSSEYALTCDVCKDYTERTCDNCGGERTSELMDGNGARICEPCAHAEYTYALEHVPEAVSGITYAAYLAECRERFMEARS